MTGFVTKRGHVWHARKDCTWLAHAHANAIRVGRTTHRVLEVDLRRYPGRDPCRVCVPRHHPAHEPCL